MLVRIYLFTCLQKFEFWGLVDVNKALLKFSLILRAVCADVIGLSKELLTEFISI
jgi:hypothetical protein